MDRAATNLPMNLESIPETSIVNDNGDEPMAPPAKKQRLGEDMSRVAEIVLVLSALGRMRGGKPPTELENELMVEARSKLADICQEFKPTDLIGSDDVKAVIEDLGLNGKLNKDQRLGFPAPKLTISEKLSLGKRKMEAAKLYPTATVSTGFVSQPNGSVASPGLAKNISVTHQWPSSEVNTTVKTTGSNFRMDRPQMMINGASQGTPVSSANYYSASWSAQPQSTISFSTAPDKKFPIQSSVKGADPSFRPFMSQTPHRTFTGTNQPMQYGQTSSSGNNHSEIATIIQKVLQPGVKQYPFWNPPSRAYMSRAMACEMCKVTINEVDSLLVCDACEKAFHLICLQANNVQGVTKSEWHCSRCVQSGKPFPPQYGRAITANRTKMPPGSAGVQSSTAKKVGSLDMKVNQQKPIVTTSTGAQKFPRFVSGAAATASRFESASVSANTTASAAKTTNIGPQCFRGSVICGTNSPAPISVTEIPNPAVTASTSAVINNDLVSKPLTPVGTVSSTCPLPVSNHDTMAATSNATPSRAITASLVAQAPTTVTENGDISSTASGTADHSISNTDLTTQVHTLTVTSSSNSQTVVLHSENAKATEDAAIGQALNADDGPQALMDYIARCENPSESTSHSAKGQESSKDDTEKFASETCQNHQPTESPAAVLSDAKITAQPSMPQENSAYQTEKTLSHPRLVVSNYHSQTEKETPNVPEDLQGKGLNG